ncbi:hypothetical protein [Novosphingobium sp. KACC 22771]|uniref:hypothetical protein n=1 Tax=Novosphingobium sp. KACC 22771 TaxID=3025670 RepID=UPI002366FA4B|nr:hypothetical protein [Novosphingobium sp. KACC 22771]WDF73625.1 hypothetical protein PQ467_06185 [Novosphingobium sp. KACC 22771]
MPSPYRHYAGKIAYLNGAGREWGRETFSASVHAHGRSLRAVCEMDEAQLLREVSWSVTSDWRPRDGFVRNVRDGQTIGTCWYSVAGNSVECQGITEEEGRIARRIETDRTVDFLGMHPLAGDAITAMVRGTDQPGQGVTLLCAANSTAHLGDEGLSVLLVEPVVTFIAPEQITVGAGTFDALHYTIRWSDHVPHLTDFWIDPVDCLPLLTVLPAIGERYELVELTRP